MVTISRTMGELAEVSESSPGYTVQATEGGRVYTLSNLRFERRPNGRRNGAVVLGYCDSEGGRNDGRYDADYTVRVID